MKIDKCELGYIAKKKKISFLWLMVSVLIGVAIFLIGYFWTHTRANIFTVFAVLLVLPAAKRVVNLVVMLPKKGVSAERYARMEKEAGEAVILTDYVFSSTEKIMHLDFVVLKNCNVIAVVAGSEQDVEYMKKYFTDCVHRFASDFHVRFFEKDDEAIKQFSRLSQAEAEPETEEKLVEHLRSMAV